MIGLQHDVPEVIARVLPYYLIITAVAVEDSLQAEIVIITMAPGRSNFFRAVVIGRSLLRNSVSP